MKQKITIIVLLLILFGQAFSIEKDSVTKGKKITVSKEMTDYLEKRFIEGVEILSKSKSDQIDSENYQKFEVSSQRLYTERKMSDNTTTYFSTKTETPSLFQLTIKIKHKGFKNEEIKMALRINLNEGIIIWYRKGNFLGASIKKSIEKEFMKILDQKKISQKNIKTMIEKIELVEAALIDALFSEE